MKMHLIIYLFLTISFSTIYAQKKTAVKHKQTKTNNVNNDIEHITRNFSCNINGKQFKPSWETIATEPKNANIHITQKDSKPYVLIMGLEINSNYVEQITFGGFNFNKIGKYNLTKDKLIFEYFYRFDKSKSEIKLSSQDIETFTTGELVISKFDTINKRFKGEFKFKLFNPKVSKDTIKVTNGKFYLNLITNYRE
ncbi:hypothetical protein ACFFLS_08990 [Flavobacterium procerum]|uniref:Uncharacterized protein n=1 Tax=Flavobacterium procerum TaxID=1455569 RepID=A0ABV6BP20_9FLAO